MAGAGSESLCVGETSRGGAEAGGGTTATVCDRGTRELAKSRWASRGAGGTMVGAKGAAVRISSRERLGAGGTTALLKRGEVRELAREISGSGATMLGVGRLELRLVVVFSSGEGGTAGVMGKTGAVRVERKPSAGGGPGFGLKASRLATAESE